MVRIAVTRGAYKLNVSAVDYVSLHRKVDVAADMTLTAELEYSPYEDQHEMQTGRPGSGKCVVPGELVFYGA